MRTLMRVTIPVERGNAAIEEGRLTRLIETTINELRPEAAYFTTHEGKRSALIVFDLKDQSQIPSIVEPWFLDLQAHVEFQPVMNHEDLKRGLSGMESTMKKDRAATGRAA